MALPKNLITYPILETILPSNKLKVKYRPYTTKEEKLLILAESDDITIKDIVNSLVQLLNNCIIEPQLDFKELPLFDISYLFLKLRIASVEQFAEFNFNNKDNIGKTCTESCPEYFPVSVDLEEVKIHFPENVSNKILLTDDETGKFGICLKYPKIGILETIGGISEIGKVDEEIIFNCLDYFYDEKAVYKVDLTDTKEIEEAKELISNLTLKQKKKIQEFFDVMPNIKHNVSVKCPRCKCETIIPLVGLKDFFG